MTSSLGPRKDGGVSDGGRTEGGGVSRGGGIKEEKEEEEEEELKVREKEWEVGRNERLINLERMIDGDGIKLYYDT